MTSGELQQNLNSVGILLTIIGTVLGFIWITATKLTRLEVKVETMWGFLIKRAVVEGVLGDHMETHSPVRLINNSGSMLEHMAEEIHKRYLEKWQKLTEAEIGLEIEKEFGNRLVKEVCIPNGIGFGVCLVIAIAAAKGTETLSEILDHAGIDKNQT